MLKKKVWSKEGIAIVFHQNCIQEKGSIRTNFSPLTTSQVTFIFSTCLNTPYARPAIITGEPPHYMHTPTTSHGLRLAGGLPSPIFAVLGKQEKRDVY